jgi:hypothetical protein
MDQKQNHLNNVKVDHFPKVNLPSLPSVLLVKKRKEQMNTNVGLSDNRVAQHLILNPAFLPICSHGNNWGYSPFLDTPRCHSVGYISH